MTLKIRERTRRCASPKEGLKQKWDEVQVVQGRKIVARFDLVEQAQEFVSRLEQLDRAIADAKRGCSH